MVLTEKPLGSQFEYKRRRMLKSEEFQGFVSDIVIPKPEIFLNYETGQGDVRGGKQVRQCLLDKLFGWLKVGQGTIPRNSLLFLV